MSHDSAQEKVPEPIAIVGIGSVRDAPGLWELLVNKRSGYTEFKEPRFSAEGFYHSNADRPGTMSSRGGFLVDEDPRLFDPTFFGINGLEAETMDPSQRKLLEVVYEAFENAGETWDTVSGTRTGVFVGTFSLDHWVIQNRDWDYPRPYATTGASTSILSNRISYMFNLRGPSLSIDTACSSSMYALHLAVNAIRDGDCDSAIVAGANWIADPGLQVALNKLGALSSTSTCHTFDESADGYARGEGFAALYLKRSTEAVADHSPIRALIRGTAVNANGRTGGITRPSTAGQEAVIRQAYKNAGNLPFTDTTYFEIHGTGTPVGDPLEVSAVGNVFSSTRLGYYDDKLYLGSVKTNLGHTEGASALAAIIKVVLALEHGVIPPSVGVSKLNPTIDFEKANAEVVTDAIIWPEHRMRRASINSFGFGGANGHCIIDHVTNVFPSYKSPGILEQPLPCLLTGGSTNGQSPTGHVKKHQDLSVDGKNGLINGHSTVPCFEKNRKPHKVRRAGTETRQLVLLPFSAHNEASLQLNIDALLNVIERHELADVAYTLSVNRSKLPKRSFRILDKNSRIFEPDVNQRVLQSPTNQSKLGFVFTGQGAQWDAMGSQLLTYRVFRDTVRHLDDVLGEFPIPPPWKIEDTLAGSHEKGFIHMPEVSQTVCTALQIGLVDLLASWSVHPSAVVGHSSGEIAAAYASGRATAAEAIAAAYFRGRAVSKNCRDGAMLAVGLSSDEAIDRITGYESEIKIAAINSPNSVTLSGDADAIDRLSVTLTQDNVFNRKLSTGGNAYHSHHMAPLGKDYCEMLISGLSHLGERGLCSVKNRREMIPWISSVTPHKHMSSQKNGSEAAEYWKANLQSPVRFSEAVTKLISMEDCPVDMMIEIGPHSALKSPIEQIQRAAGKTVALAATLKRNENSQYNMLQLAGTLFGHNVHVDLVAVNAVDGLSKDSHSLVHGCTAIDLPPYQYNYGPVIYHESRASKEHRYRRVPRHDLIGSKIAGNARLRPQWRNILRPKDLPWLSDHRLIPHAVFPAAGYMVMAMAAAAECYNELEDSDKVTGYSLRNVSIKSPLKIPEDDYGVEVLLSMELQESATAKTPAWATFSISSVSHDCKNWNQHCTGYVKVESSSFRPIECLPTEMDSRTLHAASWYKKFEEIGLGYGTAFQGLSEIRADPEQNLAIATLDLKTTTDLIHGESEYAIHPSSLDALFQLGLIACHGGQKERTTTAFVPIHLDQLDLRNGLNQDQLTALARGELRGLRGAYASLQLLSGANDVALNIKTLRCISYSDQIPDLGSNATLFSSPFTRLAWKPDIRSMNNDQARKLYPPPAENISRAQFFDGIHEIADIIVVDIYETFVMKENGPKPPGNLAHFLAWIKRQTLGERSQIPTTTKMLSKAQRLEKLQILYTKAGHITEVQIMKRLHENMEDILYERRTGVEVLLQDGLLAALYETGFFMTGAYPQLHNILDSLGHANPNLNILELGAGTGGATRVAMKALHGTNSIKRYSTYTFTDISPGFLTVAQEAMAEFRDFHYSVCNIEQDPLEQGFELEYDVVMASQTLHATSSISQTLANCRRLLKPGGKLILVENTQINVFTGVLLGTLTGYWHGIPDGRADSPFITKDSWNAALLEANFSGTEIVLDDYPHPHNTTTVLVSTAMEPARQKQEASLSTSRPSEILLLYSANQASPLLHQLQLELESRNIPHKGLTFDAVSTAIQEGAHVIALLDHENMLVNATEQSLMNFQYLSRNASSLICITSSGMVKGRSPDGSLVAGLLRTISTENPANQYLSIDIDANDFVTDDKNLARCIVDHEVALQSFDIYSIEDREFAWQDGCLWVSRVVPDGGLEKYSEIVKNPNTNGSEMSAIINQGPLRAAFETPGVLSSLYFRPYTELLQPLHPDWIEVKVAAIGLNWKDLGLSSGRFDGNNLSSEYSGVVTKKGANVTALSIGDRVFGMGKGHFGTHTRVPVAFSQALGPEDDFVEAATMPLVYMTAIYAFDYVTRLRSGQKVLIQSATGGLGLAAIQIAQLKGAEVFVTVGNKNKADFLTKNLKIPATHIFSSRDEKDMPRAIAQTGKDGFDVILSTARGDMLYDSIKALAPLGHLIDVGRMDVMDSNTMGLELFQKSANFSSFDLSLVLDNDSVVGGELMLKVSNLYRERKISPIRPFTATDISELGQTLLNFSKGTHIGKLVVTIENPNTLVKTITPTLMARFDPAARYIITGGLGGLGRSIISWMAAKGAQDFLVLSRSGAKTTEARWLVESLAKRGIRVEPVICDVSVLEDVKTVIRDAGSDRLIKGIVHSAVSYQDVTFDKVSFERWRGSVAAKVLGTKNLHEATLSISLDFFVMTTSLESIYALATQSVYTAANNFQDYFARYRRQCGLPASTASFGFINEIGTLSTDSVTVDMFARNRTLTMSETQFLHHLEPAFFGNEHPKLVSQWIGHQEDPLSAANLFTCLDPAAMATKERADLKDGLPLGAPPRWYSDSRVALIMRAFDDATRHAKEDSGQGDARNNKSGASALRQEFDNAVRKGTDERHKTVEFVTQAISTAVAEMLFIVAANVNPSRTVAEHGVDSLIAAELRNWFLLALGINISMLDLLDAHTSISSLAGNIVDEKLEEVGA